MLTVLHVSSPRLKFCFVVGWKLWIWSTDCIRLTYKEPILEYQVFTWIMHIFLVLILIFTNVRVWRNYDYICVLVASFNCVYVHSHTCCVFRLYDGTGEETLIKATVTTLEAEEPRMTFVCRLSRAVEKMFRTIVLTTLGMNVNPECTKVEHRIWANHSFF